MKICCISLQYFNFKRRKLWNSFSHITFYSASEQALRDALAAEQEREGELATTSLEFEFKVQLPCRSPSIELSDFRQSARSGNELECKQTL